MEVNSISEYYELGTKQALFDKLAELTPLEKEYRLPWELPLAATGGMAGGFGGGILGSLAGAGLSRLLDTDERKSTGVGALAGLLLGGGLGAYGGYRLGNRFANNVARRAIVGDFLHSQGIPPVYPKELEERVRKELVARGILSED